VCYTFYKLPATLRTVGGSIAMTIPKAIVDELNLKAETKVDLTVEDGKLVVRANKRPKYKLDDLLAQCDQNAQRNPEQDEWLNTPTVGREIIE
jgi:antitoxin ChpS